MPLKAERFGDVPAGLPRYHTDFLRKLRDAVEIITGARRSQNDTTEPPRSQAITLEDLRTVPSYANNAAALVGGLKPGDIYRTVDDLKVVHT